METMDAFPLVRLFVCLRTSHSRLGVREVGRNVMKVEHGRCVIGSEWFSVDFYESIAMARCKMSWER
jgi:hypothetical protein